MAAWARPFNSNKVSHIIRQVTGLLLRRPLGLAHHLHVSLPASKKALTRLGERLAAGRLIEGDDVLFEDTMLAFDDVRQQVFRRLASGLDLGSASFTMTSRTKTRSTLIDKLRAQPGLGLPYIRDIAGIRIVLEAGGGLFSQDLVSEQIQAMDLLDSLKVIDRRVEPVQGYRALHLTGAVGGLSVEIQIRTDLQDAWANLFERLGDMWGRSFRYEDLPEAPFEALTFRQKVVSIAQRASLKSISALESAELTYREAERRTQSVKADWRSLPMEVRAQMAAERRETISANFRADLRTSRQLRDSTERARTGSLEMLDQLSELLHHAAAAEPGH